MYGSGKYARAACARCLSVYAYAKLRYQPGKGYKVCHKCYDRPVRAEVVKDPVLPLKDPQPYPYAE